MNTTAQIINQAVDQAETPVAPVDNATPETVETEAKDEPSAAKAEDDAPFPKKAINALSRRDKQIGKYKAELAAARAELDRFRQPQTQGQQKAPQSGDEPNEASFDNYGEYLKAIAKHEARKEFQGEQTKAQESQRTAQEQAWVNEREEVVATRAQELLTSNPEYQHILTEHADILDDMPAHVERAFLESDDAPMAFIVLAKEGKLEALASMSPYRAAMEIGRAIDRGAVQSKPKVTQAPTPIAAAKGTGGGGGKSLDNMSADELRAWRKS